MGRYILAHCPHCGMDSGERRVTDDVPIEYIVVCTTCGYHTDWHPTQSAASNEWNRGGKKNDIIRNR